jgi:DNA-directed RNA polymerase specialized sigma subunit
LRDLALSLSLELLTPTQAPIDEVLAEDSEREERSALLSLAFERLPERDQALIIAVYDLRDTGDCAARYAEREGLSRSNVSYKHKSALARLRAYVLELSAESDL